MGRSRRFTAAVVALSAVAAGCGTTAGLLGESSRSPGGPQKAPIVFLHGMAGFVALAPGLDYWYGVKDALHQQGYDDVYFLKVDPFQSVEVRAQEAAAELDTILAETGAPRVHLVAHSQGGLDARYLISSLHYGDRVATLTTIATPHHGSRVADVAAGLLPGDVGTALGTLADLFLGPATGTNADIAAQVHELTTTWADGTFNPQNPDDSRVSYYSVGGYTQSSLWIDPMTTDVVQPILAAAFGLDSQFEAPTDGLVSVASAHHGHYLGTVAADHLMEVGWVPGYPDLAFDHLKFYRKLAAFLEGDGPSPLP